MATTIMISTSVKPALRGGDFIFIDSIVWPVHPADRVCPRSGGHPGQGVQHRGVGIVSGNRALHERFAAIQFPGFKETAGRPLRATRRAPSPFADARYLPWMNTDRTGQATRECVEMLWARPSNGRPLRKRAAADDKKSAMAGRLRRKTTMTCKWIAERLAMGTGQPWRACLRRSRSAREINKSIKNGN